jgi:hypothetical protein
MSRTTLDMRVEDMADGAVLRDEDRGWRAFLGSKTWGAILGVACVLGVLAILSAHPFSSKSVSARVSDRLGHQVACSDVGLADIGGTRSTVYRCAGSGDTAGADKCFVVSGADVKQFSGNRELGC